jgi:hypothetical protein
VGFSINKEESFGYNDSQTADDAFAAIHHFTKIKAP